MHRISRVTLSLYLALLLLLVASVAGGVRVSVPVSTAPTEGMGVPLPSPLLEALVAEGLPELALVRPPKAFAGAFGPARIAAWVIEALTTLRLGDPLSIIGQALPGVATAPTQTEPRSEYPTLLLATGGGGVRQRRDVVLYGRSPLVAVYETNTRDSFWSEVRYSGRAGGLPVTSDPRRNMIAVGTFLGQALWRNGVPTALSKVVNDAHGMIGAYVHSKAVAESLLTTYPTIEVLLDVDRYDRPVGQVHGAARIVLIVGTNARLPDPHWRQNLAFAKELGAMLQTIEPGLLVGIYPSPDSLNQELFPRALTVAIGGPDNTLAEEQRAATLLARALAELLGGAGAGG